MNDLHKRADNTSDTPLENLTVARAIQPSVYSNNDHSKRHVVVERRHLDQNNAQWPTLIKITIPSKFSVRA